MINPKIQKIISIISLSLGIMLFCAFALALQGGFMLFLIPFIAFTVLLIAVLSFIFGLLTLLITNYKLRGWIGLIASLVPILIFLLIYFIAKGTGGSFP